jgi:WD40 repeat protein/serine/threonine protein kinase
MTPEQFAQIEEIFHSARELSGQARTKFLANACGNDETLRLEVESLLHYEERTQSPFKTPVVDHALRALAESDGESLTGKTLDHYQILSRIGEGGMGEVYAAQDQRLNRKVALKFLPVAFTKDDDQVRRFHQEARAASALNHPNIVTIYDIGQLDSLHFIAMEFIDGETLRQKVLVQMPVREVISIAIQVASGLAAAHQAGILHRDIKPENLMSNNDGSVKILDFGIAKFKEQTASSSLPQSEPGVANSAYASVAAGTLSYMSPEQARLEQLDARTDIFSLGIVLFELVAGRRPFSGETQTEILHAILNDEAPTLSAIRKNLPPDLERIIGKAIKKNPEERYQSAKEMLADLKEFNDVTDAALDERERANRMLVQYLSMYAVDERALIPITKLWFIHHRSTLERGERGRGLFRKSLRQGILRSSALGLLILVLTTAAAAWLSRSEEWTAVRLSDGHTAAVRRAIFSPDGRRLVSVGEDKKIIVWDFARRERIATLTDHTDVVTSVAFSPDGKWFATGSKDTTVIIWDAARLEKVKVLREHRSEVNAVAFSPDGRLLASASEPPDFRTIIWTTDRWEKDVELAKGCGYCNLLFSPDSKWLLNSNDLLSWNLTSGQQAQTHDESMNWQALSLDAKLIVSINPQGYVYFREIKQSWHTAQLTFLGKYRGHQDNGRAVAFSPDGHLVATGSDDIVLWDATTRTILTHLKYTAVVWGLEFSPDGRWLVSTHGDGAIQIWDVAERQLLASLNDHSGPVRAVAYSPDGKRIASASEDHSVIIWSAETGHKEATLIGHDARVMAVAFSPDGRWLASCDFDLNVIRWELDQRRPKWNINLAGGNNNALAISPDGHWVATSRTVHDSADGKYVVKFGLDTRRPITGARILDDFEGVPYGNAFSADGKWLVYVTDRGQIALLDVQHWNLVQRLTSNNTSFITVSFSPDGKWLVTGDDEGGVRLWSVSPLREVALIGKHASRIKSVAFSPDGGEVASAGDDRNIYLWNVSRRSLITSIGTNTAPVLSVAFSPDGKKLVAGGHDNSVRIFTRHRTLWGYALD